MKRNSHWGFTLIELMYTLAVAGILLAVAVPAVTVLTQNSRITASINDLVAGLQLARSEAVKRRDNVRICRSNQFNADAPACGAGNGWEDGWVVFADTDNNGTFDAATDTVLRRSSELGSNVRVSAIGGGTVATGLTFDSSGFPAGGNVGAGGSGLIFCDGRDDDDAGRILVVSPTGRPNVRSLHEAPFVGLSCSS